MHDKARIVLNVAAKRTIPVDAMTILRDGGVSKERRVLDSSVPVRHRIVCCSKRGLWLSRLPVNDGLTLAYGKPVLLDFVAHGHEAKVARPALLENDILNQAVACRCRAGPKWIEDFDISCRPTANFFSAGFDAVFDVPARHPGSGSAFSAVIA